MKSTSTLFAILCFAIAFPEMLLAAAAKPDLVETRWPGITVTVYQIARLPGNRVSVKFVYRAAGNAPSESNIADRPVETFSVDLDDPEGGPVQFLPYTLEKEGRLIDSTTGKTFPTSELKPGDADAVHPGRTEVLEVVRPDDAFFIGAVFECPPVNQDDPPKEQRVSFNLPGVLKPINGVLLPREENVLLEFFRRPQKKPRIPEPAPAG